MIPKQILKNRLSRALRQDVDSSTFTWFFREFCDRIDTFCVIRNERHQIIKRWNVSPPDDLRHAKYLTLEEAEAFSHFCGYDLTKHIPTALW